MISSSSSSIGFRTVTLITIVKALLILLVLQSVIAGTDEDTSTHTSTTGSVSRLATSTTTTTKSSSWWKPKATDNVTWQWQLSNSNNINMSYNVTMYDVDLFDVSNETITKLHENNHIVICYFSAGTYESYRSDWSTYFKFITPNVMYTGKEPPFGKIMSEWNDERWLDVRRIDLLQDIMISRLQLAVAKKCDGVEPDNMDVYTNKKDSGFTKITYQHQLTYNKFIAEQAHLLNLSIGIKNDLYQLNDLLNDYDWALNEQCFQYNECYYYRNFTSNTYNKAVFGVEYSGDICKFCKKALSLQLSWLRKRLTLDSYRRGCEDVSVKKQCKL